MGARRQLACAADPPGAIGRVAERDGSTPIYKWDNQMSRSLMCLCHVRSVTRVGSEWVPEGYSEVSIALRLACRSLCWSPLLVWPARPPLGVCGCEGTRSWA